MCRINPSESGHGGGFAPCEEYKILKQKYVQLLEHREFLFDVVDNLIRDNEVLAIRNVNLFQRLDEVSRAPCWTKYDGTEITLPPVGKMVLVSAKAGWRDYDKRRDRGEMMEWRYQGLPLEIGDRWMCWPEGVE